MLFPIHDMHNVCMLIKCTVCVGVRKIGCVVSCEVGPRLGGCVDVILRGWDWISWICSRVGVAAGDELVACVATKPTAAARVGTRENRGMVLIREERGVYRFEGIAHATRERFFFSKRATNRYV